MHCSRFANYCQHSTRWTELQYERPCRLSFSLLEVNLFCVLGWQTHWTNCSNSSKWHLQGLKVTTSAFLKKLHLVNIKHRCHISCRTGQKRSVLLLLIIIISKQFLHASYSISCVLNILSMGQEPVLTSTAHLLEKVSLPRCSLGHLPAWGQGHVVRNLIRRLAEMLRWGTCWGHPRQGATRNGSHLQGGRRRVGAYMVRGERTAGPGISARLG